MPDAGILATLLLLLGLFLLGLEFFIPSFGMILVVATLSLVVSFWSACKAWWGVNPMFFWTYIVMLTAGIPGSLVAAITLIQRTSLGDRMILRPSGSVDEKEANPLEILIGKAGVSNTLMTPGGIVLLDGERVHAESQGMLIEPGTPVIVVAVKGSRIVVRPRTSVDDKLPAGKLPEKPEQAEEIATGLRIMPEPDPLDFDIPEDYTNKS